MSARLGNIGQRSDVTNGRKINQQVGFIWYTREVMREEMGGHECLFACKRPFSLLQASRIAVVSVLATKMIQSVID